MSIFWPLSKRQFFVLTMFFFLSRITKNHFYWHNFCKKHPYEKFRFFPLRINLFFFHKYPKTIFSDIISVKMSTFWPFLKLEFFPLKIILLFHKYRKTMFFGIISVKNSDNRNFDFWTKSWINPFGNCPFFGLF